MTSLEVQQHNQTVLDNLQPGDLLEFERGMINHWAVYIGSEEVVHFLGDCGGRDQNRQCKTCFISTCKGLVSKDAFFDVVGNSKVNKNNSKDTKLKPFKQHEIVERALSTEPREYDIAFKNCEHFATWCRYGKEKFLRLSLCFLNKALVGSVGWVPRGLPWVLEAGNKEKSV